MPDGLTFYLIDSVPIGATLHRSLGMSAPTAALTGTGWVAANKAAGQKAVQLGGTIIARNSTSWSTTPRPSTGPASGDSWRSQNPITGTFDSGAWTVSLTFRSSAAAGAYTGRFRINGRLWRMAAADGSGAAYELSQGIEPSDTTTANLSTTSDTTLTLTFNPGSYVEFSNEYLWLNLGIEVITAGSGNAPDVVFSVGYARLITPYLSTRRALSQSTPIGAAAGSFALEVAHALSGVSVGAAAPTTLATPVYIEGVDVTLDYGELVTVPIPQRAYLSWVQLTLPPYTGDSVTLDGVDLTVDPGTIDGGTKRAYVAWARLRLPPSRDLLLYAPPITVDYGTIEAFSGSTVELDGVDVTVEAGEILFGQLLTGVDLRVARGDIDGQEETRVFTGALATGIAQALRGYDLTIASPESIGFEAVPGGTWAPLDLGASLPITFGVGTISVRASHVLPMVPEILALTGSLRGRATVELSGVDLTAAGGAFSESPELVGVDVTVGYGEIGTNAIWYDVPPDTEQDIWTMIDRGTSPWTKQ